jgi:hypothetical protein
MFMFLLSMQFKLSLNLMLSSVLIIFLNLIFDLFWIIFRILVQVFFNIICFNLLLNKLYIDKFSIIEFQRRSRRSSIQLNQIMYYFHMLV